MPMVHAEALNVVRALAHGVDPLSGEVFSPESPYQRADTVRALMMAVQALEEAERAARRRSELPAKAGEPWTEEEDRRLLAGFDAGSGLAELAARHQRTQTGIRARLVKYGRLAT
jgi:hypothetical protein